MNDLILIFIFFIIIFAVGIFIVPSEEFKKVGTRPEPERTNRPPEKR
jgi:hypothetical protein